MIVSAPLALPATLRTELDRQGRSGGDSEARADGRRSVTSNLHSSDIRRCEPHDLERCGNAVLVFQGLT
jgi:hypothetical protein